MYVDFSVVDISAAQRIRKTDLCNTAFLQNWEVDYAKFDDCSRYRLPGHK